MGSRSERGTMIVRFPASISASSDSTASGKALARSGTYFTVGSAPSFLIATGGVRPGAAAVSTFAASAMAGAGILYPVVS